MELYGWGQVNWRNRKCTMGFGEARVAGESYLGVCNIGIYDGVCGCGCGGCGCSRGVWGELRFSCGIAKCGRVLISMFQRFFGSISKILILGGRLGIRL